MWCGRRYDRMAGEFGETSIADCGDFPSVLAELRTSLKEEGRALLCTTSLPALVGYASRRTGSGGMKNAALGAA
jgi:hypothetical protein